MNARSLFTVLLLCFALAGIGQNNFTGFNYQAVVRNATGDPLPNQAIGVRVQMNPTGSNGYTERHTVTTDANGQIKLVMGEGTPEVGSTVPTFAGLDWTSGAVMNYTVSVDITGGTTYTALGSGQFKSVPFALRSLTSGGGSAVGWALSGNDLSNTNSGNVGIGTPAPTQKLDVVSSGNAFVRTSTTNGTSQSGLIMSKANAADWSLYPQPVNGAGNLMLDYAGSTKFFVAGTGEVGIGTTAPDSRLDVNGAVSISGPGLTGAVNEQLVITVDSANQCLFQAPVNNGTTKLDYVLGWRGGGTPGMVIKGATGNMGVGIGTPANKLDVEGGAAIGAAYSGTNAAPANGLLVEGNVGIGTPTATYKLDVNGSARINGTNGAVLALSSNTGDGTNQWQVQSNAFNNGNFGVVRYGPGADETKSFLITSAGNFGLGTASPLSKLDVEGGATIGATYSGTNAAPVNGLLVQGNVGIGTTASVNRIDVEGGAAIGSSYSGTNTAPANGLLVEGDVGIGTPSPGKKLTVHTALGGLGNYGIEHTNGTVQVGTYLDGTHGWLGTNSNHPLAFYTNGGSKQVVLKTNGNFGIGTNIDPQYKLDVSGTARINGTNGAILALSSNTGDGTNQWQVQTNAFNNGNFGVVRYGPGADESKSFMITSAGNVGIGMASPQSKLAVNGTITCKEVNVTLAGFPDYVFRPGYDLMPLNEVADYIQANGHLPNVPSECEVEENGIGLGDLNKILLEKIEELTLHMIEKDQQILEFTNRLEAAERRLNITVK